MIELSLRCPRCGLIRRWISYDTNKLEELDKARAMCFRHKGTFRVKSGIVKIVRMEAHPNRVPHSDIVKILMDDIKAGETSTEKLKTKVMRIGATDVDFARGMNVLHNAGIIYYPNKFCVKFN